MGQCDKMLRRQLFCAVLALLLPVTGCGNRNAALKSTEESIGETPQLQQIQSSEELSLSGETEELPEVYQQMLLYMQEGLYEHGIDGMYQVYFGAVKGFADRYYCDILLEGEGALWRESIAYSYDEDSGWYTFYGQYEPILAEGDMESEDFEFVKEMRKNYVYAGSVSGEIHFPYPVRYHAENGPVERDARIETCFHDSREGTSYSIDTMLYTYVDERLGTVITILYPAVWVSEAYEDAAVENLQDSINEQIRTAFFYSYFGDEGMLQPQKELYATIDRNFIITRRDEDYLSMRIYEGNDVRGAVHPNEWETGITIDMHTGRALQFCDVVGEDFDLETFIDKGAFRCMWFWENDTGEYWLSHFYRRSSWDSCFYLTDDALGLITEESRYYTLLEADFEDLGISDF